MDNNSIHLQNTYRYINYIIFIVDPPERVHVFGQGKVKEGEIIMIECESSPSIPASSLSWRVEEDGNSRTVQGQDIQERKACTFVQFGPLINRIHRIFYLNIHDMSKNPFITNILY